MTTTVSKTVKSLKKYFVYLHMREDNDEVFYVGIGTQPKNGLQFERAYTSYGRNPTWKGITRYTRYYVRIIMEADTREQVEAREVELIAHYGRRDQGTGQLANRTDGGEKVKAPNTRTKRKKNAS